MKTSARLLQIWRQNGCLAYDQAQDILDDLENLSEVEAERDAMSEHLDDLSVCLCGCPIADHENVDEGAESCGNDDHECFRVYPAVLQIVTALRAGLSAARGRVARLTEALRGIYETKVTRPGGSFGFNIRFNGIYSRELSDLVCLAPAARQGEKEKA